MDFIPRTQDRFPVFDDLLENYSTQATRNSVGPDDPEVIDAFTDCDGCRAVVQHVNMRRTVVIIENDDMLIETRRLAD